MSKTFAEMLDDAEDGEQFGNILSALFMLLESRMEEEDGSA